MMMHPGSAETASNTPPRPPHPGRHRYQETEDDTRGSWQPESPTRRDDGRLTKIQQLGNDDSARQEKSPIQDSSKKKKKKKRNKQKSNDNDAGRTSPAAKCKKTTSSSPNEPASPRKQTMPNEILENDAGTHPALESGRDVVPPHAAVSKKTKKKKPKKKRSATRKSQEEFTHGKEEDNNKMLDYSQQSKLGSEKDGSKLAPQEVSVDSKAVGENKRKGTKKTTTKKKKKAARSQKVPNVDSSVLLLAPAVDSLGRELSGNEDLIASPTTPSTSTSRGIGDLSKEERNLNRAQIMNDAASPMITTRDQRRNEQDPPKKNNHRQNRALPLYISSDDDDDDDEDEEDRPGAIHVGDSRGSEEYSENARNDDGALATIEVPTSRMVSNNPLVLEANLVEEEDEERLLDNYIRNKTVQATQVEGVEAAERKKRIQRRRQFLGCSCLCISSIVIAIVLSLKLQSDPEIPPTSAPTASPAPSLAPTTSVAPSSNPSDFPTYSRLELLYQTIGPDITDDMSVLRDTSSGQYAALSWLATEDEVDLIDELRETGSAVTHRQLIERYTMFVLYSEVVTVSLLSFDFFAVLDTCNWHTAESGVSCPDGELFVDKLLVEGLLLSGTMPTEIALLRGLRILDISNNQFTGTIPSIIGSLTNLVTLNVTKNLLEGTVPSELSSLSNLRELLLEKNDLVGDVDALFCDGEAPVSLDSFHADCAGEGPEVTCSCCTLCCDRAGSCSN